MLGFFHIQFVAHETLIHVFHHFLFLTGIEKASEKCNKSKTEESRPLFRRQSIKL